jgi:hypothetical protein
LDVQQRRVQHRDGAVVLADQQADLGAAQDHSLGARPGQAGDDPGDCLPGGRQDLALAQLVEDDPVDQLTVRSRRR